MKKILLTFLLLVGCTHEMTQNNRSVSSAPAEKIEILDPNQEGAFVKLNLQRNSDLNALKQVLSDSLNNQQKISELHKLNNDYFKSVKWALKLTDQLLSLNLSSEELNTNPQYTDLVDILHALRNRFVNPFESKVELLAIPFLAAKYTYRPEIQIPNNIQIETPVIVGLTDTEIQSEIKRKHLLETDKIICTYDKPKDGWGYKPGFKSLCDDRKLKIKFGNETLSGPFNSRIFRTLGYLTPKIDVLDNFRMKYDRRYITEFNSQKDVKIDIRLLGAKLKSVSTKRAHDPFSYIKNVTLKDGTVISAPDFKNKLFPQNKFDENFESQVDYLTFNRGSVTEGLDVIGVGPWSFEEIHHQNNPAIHQGVILSAWVGNSDIHLANNQLIIQKGSDKNTAIVRPIFIDVGFGLGRTDSALKPSSSDINNMGWTISEKPIQNDTSQFPFENKVILSGYVSQQYNSLLTGLKFEDVFGALKNICRLSGEQIKTAFIESGATEDEARLGTSKLLNRRSKLIYDFGIQNQLKSCYEPQKRF